ncbi:MAG: hypothetical protein H7X95_13660, partial [Deltaproteobacteria bacterium]|nr:hypothetical protein [Deltaproteobacteria bacterium]
MFSALSGRTWVWSVGWLVASAFAACAIGQTASFRPVALPGDAVPGTSHTLMAFTDRVQIDQSGRVLFNAYTALGGNGRRGCFLEDGKTLRAIMVDGDPSPPGFPEGTTIAEGGSNNITMSPEGLYIAGYSTIAGPGITPSNDALLWRWHDGVFEILAREGDPR